jgi:hypothetical protein
LNTSRIFLRRVGLPLRLSRHAISTETAGPSSSSQGSYPYTALAALALFGYSALSESECQDFASTRNARSKVDSTKFIKELKSLVPPDSIEMDPEELIQR